MPTPERQKTIRTLSTFPGVQELLEGSRNRRMGFTNRMASRRCVRSADCLRCHSQGGRSRPDPRTTPHSRIRQGLSQQDGHRDPGHVRLEARPEPRAVSGCPRRNAGAGLIAAPSPERLPPAVSPSAFSPPKRKHRGVKAANDASSHTPQTRHFDSPLRSWERASLAPACPIKRTGKKDNETSEPVSRNPPNQTPVCFSGITLNRWLIDSALL